MIMEPPPTANAMVLAVAFGHQVIEPNVEMGFEQFTLLADKPIKYEEFCKLRRQPVCARA